MLKRDAIRALHGFSVQQIDHTLSALAVWVHPVSLHYIWRPELRDPGDEMVLKAAVNGQVSAQVTHNVRDFFSGSAQGSPAGIDPRPIDFDHGKGSMSTFALRLTDSLYVHAKQLAEQDQASLNQFITVAVAEKVSAYQTAEFFT